MYQTKPIKIKIMAVIENYFWNHHYRHEMRSLKPSRKMQVYKEFIEFDIHKRKATAP